MLLSIDEKNNINNCLEDIIEASYAMSTRAIWFYIVQTLPIETQKEGFLYVLEILLRQGKVKMGRGHKLLDMSIKEVIEAFRNNWPSEEEFDDVLFSLVKGYKVPKKKHLQTHYWTPGDLVWVDPDDGHELWSTDADAEE